MPRFKPPGRQQTNGGSPNSSSEAPTQGRTLADAFKGMPPEMVRKAWLQGQMLAARDLAMREGAPAHPQPLKARAPRR